MYRVISLPRSGGSLAPRGPLGDARRLVVQHERVAFEVDVATGSVVTTEALPIEGSAYLDPVLALARSNMQLVETDTAAGPTSAILGGDGSVLASFAGTLKYVAVTRDVFGGVVWLADRSLAIIAGVLGDPERQVLRIAEAGCAVTAGSDYVVVAGGPGVMHVFRSMNGRLSRVTTGRPGLGLLGDAVTGMHVVSGVVWFVVGRELASLDVSDLPLVERASLTSRYEPVIPPPSPAAEPAKVAFVLASAIGLDHPHLGRIVVPRTPEHPVVQKGDSVMLEDVYEELPGIYRARAFRTSSGLSSARPPPAPREISAPQVEEELLAWELAPSVPVASGASGAGAQRRL